MAHRSGEAGAGQRYGLSRGKRGGTAGHHRLPEAARDEIMKRLPIVFALALALEIIASVSIHPSGAVRSVASNRELLAGAEVDPAVLQVVERSCQNCHSEKTEWPWYSRVAPMS